jgi:outer membrane protein
MNKRLQVRSMKSRIPLKQLTLLGYLLSLMVGNLSAQQPLSLDEAIQTALRKNLNLEIQRNEVAASQIQNTYGVAGGLPTVSGTANDQAQVTDIYQKLSTGTIIERNGALGNNLTASINGTMVLYNGLRIQATKDRLDQVAQQSQQLLAAQIQDIVAAVMTQYYDVRRQEAYLKTIDSSMVVARENIKIVTARQLGGFANVADTLQARIDLNALQQQRLQQVLTIRQAKADLVNLLNLDPNSDPVLTDSIVVNAGLRWDSLAAGLRQNPNVLAADRQVEIQQLLQHELSTQRMPTLRANAGYNFAYNISNGGFNLLSRNIGPYVGLNLSVPIYNGGSLKRQEQVGALATKNAELTRERLLQDQETALWKSWQTYQNALALLETERENAQLTQQLLSLMLQKYGLRLATILELKQAQTSFEESGYRLVNLEFAAKAAEIELLRLAGKLP